MLYFGIARGYIVTAEKDGAINMKARIAAAIDANGANGCTMALINQANAAPELLDVLERILRAHDSGNNGAVMGEAKICTMFADQARTVIAKAKGE